MRKVSYTLVILIGLSSCKKEGCTDSNAINYVESAKKDDGSCEYETVIDEPVPTPPSTYAFVRNGTATVSFTGQVHRMDMLSELSTYLKSSNTPGVNIEKDKLLAMFANENNPFLNKDINASGKDLKSKTASNDPTITAQFESWMDAIATLSDSTVSDKYEGSDGIGGVVKSGSKAYLFNHNGIEYTQLIEKGLMGAVFMHQISFVYLGDEKMNVDNETVESGQNYTKMEHHFDEAFGYFFGTVNYPTDGTDRFWGKYANGRDPLLGCNKVLMDAFIKGRFAITQKDYAERDAQILIIRNEVERVCAATAIHYLNATKQNLTDDALRNHALSEAWAFMDDLRYAKNGKLSVAQIAAHKATIGSNFYNVSTANLNKVIDDLAGLYGMENIKSQL